MPVGLLLLIAAIILIVLNPFSGAALIGAVTLGVLAVVTLISIVLFATVWRGMERKHDELVNRRF